MKEKKRKLHWYQTRKVRNALKRLRKIAGYFFTILGSGLKAESCDKTSETKGWWHRVLRAYLWKF